MLVVGGRSELRIYKIFPRVCPPVKACDIRVLVMLRRCNGEL